MTTRVEIDLNVRVRGRQTVSGFEDVAGPLAVGDVVEVFESESGLHGAGRVTDIDAERRLVYLAVDWAALRDDDLGEAFAAESLEWAQATFEAGVESWPGYPDPAAFG